MIICIVRMQSRPFVIQNEDLDGPKVWESIDCLEDWLAEPTPLIQAAEDVWAFDISNGEVTELL